jgi:hypothetical protein
MRYACTLIDTHEAEIVTTVLGETKIDALTRMVWHIMYDVKDHDIEFKDVDFKKDTGDINIKSNKYRYIVTTSHIQK